jgi:hypothetical protein
MATTTERPPEAVEGSAVELGPEHHEHAPPPDPPGPPAGPAGTALVPTAAAGGSTAIIHADSPAEVLERAEEIANLLSRVIVAQGMRTLTGRQKVPKTNPDGTVERNERGYPVEEWRDKWHVNVEGWQTLASFLGIAPRTVYSRPVRGDDGQPRINRYIVKERRTKGQGPQREVIEREYEVHGYDWEARVVAVKDGVVVGEAEALCTRSESSWAQRDDFALSSMAQTRATSRAIAAAARWIVTLAGFSGTPAEEVTKEPGDDDHPAAGGPAFGPAADDETKRNAVAAAAYLLDVADNDERAVAVDTLGTIARELCGGYLPASVARAVIRLAGRLQREARAQDGDGSAEDPDEIPATDDVPDADVPPEPAAAADPGIEF